MKEKESRSSQGKSTKTKKGKGVKGFLASRGILSNILLMIVLTIVLLFTIHIGMGLYTRHNQNVPIPAIQGKPLGEAIRLLEDASLTYQVVDSVYSKTEPAGTVYDVTPKSGHKVKPGRIIFLSIYTREPRKKPIPQVEGMGVRPVLGLLSSLGFERIETRIVSTGRYNGECQGVELKGGKSLKPGEMVAITQTLVVLVKGTVLDSLNTISLIDTVDVGGYTGGTTIERTDSTASQPSKPTKDPEQWW